MFNPSSQINAKTLSDCDYNRSNFAPELSHECVFDRLWGIAAPILHRAFSSTNVYAKYLPHAQLRWTRSQLSHALSLSGHSKQYNEFYAKLNDFRRFSWVFGEIKVLFYENLRKIIQLCIKYRVFFNRKLLSSEESIGVSKARAWTPRTVNIGLGRQKAGLLRRITIYYYWSLLV